MTASGDGAPARRSSRSHRPVETDDEEPLGSLLARIGDFVEDLTSRWWSRVELRLERTKIAARRSAVRVAMVVAAGVVGLVFVCAAVVFLLRGACLGLTQLFGGREWLGDLVGGALALALVAGGTALALRRASRHDDDRLEAKEKQVERAEHPRGAGSTAR